MKPEIVAGDYIVGDRVRVTDNAYVSDYKGKFGDVVKTGASSSGFYSVTVRFDDGAQASFAYKTSLELTPRGYGAPAVPDNDPVNNPKHYTSHPSGVECIQITSHMGFLLGNAVKYIWRADLKNDAIEDLKKARFYLDREIVKREKESASNG